MKLIDYTGNWDMSSSISKVDYEKLQLDMKEIITTNEFKTTTKLTEYFLNNEVPIISKIKKSSGLSLDYILSDYYFKNKKICKNIKN